MSPHVFVRRLYLAAFLAFLSTLNGSHVQASDLTDVRLLTSRIIVLHFDDGYIRHHGYHEASEADTAVSDPLDTTLAAQPGTYSISSSDDPDYAQPRSPVRIGRKSKGKDFSRKCKWNGSQCVNDIVFEHDIYLVLPVLLKTGAHYSVALGGTAKNRSTARVTFDESSVRSDAIHISQVGYRPPSKVKYGYVSSWMGDLGSLDLDPYAGARFTILHARSRATVFTGQMQLRFRKSQAETGQANDTPGGNFSGSDVWECNFSSLQQPGEYVLSVEGIGCSYPFTVAEQALREAFYTTVRGLYHERAGIDLQQPYTSYTRPADHTPGTTLIRYTPLRYMDQTTESGNHDEVYAHLGETLSQTWGWYHDAGDWDGYPTHSAVPKYLLTVFELAPGQFSDGESNVPESANGIPDIIDEAAWLVNYYRRNVGPTGGIFGSRITGDLAGGDTDGVPSWEDARQWIAFGEEPLASFDFAGIAAQTAYCLKIAASTNPARRAGPRRARVSSRTGDAGLGSAVRSYTAAARASYDWARTHLKDGDDTKVKSARMYAAAWLYKLTGEASFQAQFKADNEISPSNLASFDAQSWGAWAYATTPEDTPSLDTNLKSQLIQACRSYADTTNVDAVQKRSFRQGGHFWMPMLIGQATTPWVLPSIVAFELTGEQKYLDCVETTANYMLGGNPLNMVWVTGLGHRFPQEILHLDSWYDGIDQMVPGLVPYGPHKGDRNGWNGPWDPDYARDRAVYPEVGSWPGHELYFENRYCPITNEFTVHQNVAPAAAVYAYLSGPVPGFHPNQAPAVVLKAVAKGQTVNLSAEATDPDGWIYAVEYYADGHKVGESSEAPFILEVSGLQVGTHQVSAVAIDNRGLRSHPAASSLELK